jgi:hypothetical protein
MRPKKATQPKLTDAQVDAAVADATRDAWVKREYELGQLPIAEMSRHSGLTRQAIQKRAKKNRWVRNLLPAVQAKVRDQLLRDAAPEGTLPEQAVEAAAERAVEVVRQHRTSLRRLNRIAARLIESVEQHLDGKLDVIPWMRIHDTVPGVVLRVAQALSKTVPLERIAFSVGASEDPDKPKEQGPALPDWRTLFERAGLRERPDPGTGSDPTAR